MLSLLEFKEGCMIEIHYEMEHFSAQLKFFLHRKFYLWLSTKSSRTYILLHIWQFIIHFILMTRWAVWAVALTYGYILPRTIWVTRIGRSFHGHQLDYQWAYQFWNRRYSLWLLEAFRMLWQVLELSASRKAHVTNKSWGLL